MVFFSNKDSGPAFKRGRVLKIKHCYWWFWKKKHFNFMEVFNIIVITYSSWWKLLLGPLIFPYKDFEKALLSRQIILEELFFDGLLKLHFLMERGNFKYRGIHLFKMVELQLKVVTTSKLPSVNLNKNLCFNHVEILS